MKTTSIIQSQLAINRSLINILHESESDYRNDIKAAKDFCNYGDLWTFRERTKIVKKQIARLARQQKALKKMLSNIYYDVFFAV